MKTNTNINMGRWNDLDDKLLARIVIEGVRNGSTQIQTFKRAGLALNRTPGACGFRWNKTLRPEYKEAFKEAVKEHRLRTGKVRSVSVQPMHPDDAKLIEDNSVQPKPERTPMTWSEYVKKYMLETQSKLEAKEEEVLEVQPIHEPIKTWAELGVDESELKVGTPIRPAHYHKGGIDILGFLSSHFGEDKGYTVHEAFCIGNIIKYVARYKQKNGMEDLEKAQYYLNQLKQQGE